MALSAEDVIRIGNLARLSLTPAEVVELTGQLGKIVGLVEQLAEVDTENVVPMVHAFDLQNCKVSLPNGEVRTIRVCTQCIRSGRIRKAVRAKPFALPK